MPATKFAKIRRVWEPYQHHEADLCDDQRWRGGYNDAPDQPPCVAAGTAPRLFDRQAQIADRARRQQQTQSKRDGGADCEEYKDQ
ncbi:hypothetical protein FFI89_020715 [Bradyrhizobium sp. KBS0727]|jgi:hypothetical protein|uniref:hypothetical protein n=1 Tax=unclassified Bradyrhizobium TaxID=2631580 RepID=UPI00110D814E|nr:MULTISPECIES: hypothetical protein [unclassified Bradyrhizobium]QDW39359.1 hypothetical protein FFI71_020720 [Bradyrhizobium sp. KBS0725]QDW45962.1 hypothetical protein FFI89_020715 [Bradyrhizobium sp. KBS0727]